MTWRLLIRWATLVAVAAAVSVGLVACSGPRFDVPGRPAIGEIVLAGNTANSTLIIDELLTFQVTGEGKQLSFKVREGLHHIRIEKNGAAVVDRHVTLAAGQTLEISVP